MSQFLSRFGKRITLSSISGGIICAGFYQYHLLYNKTNTILAIKNDPNEVHPYDNNELFHDYASSANNNNALSRITIPSGKATVINYNPISQSTKDKVDHIIVTIQGEGEIQYSPITKTTTTNNNNKIIYGTQSPPPEIIQKTLTSGGSIGIPQNNWHQIINKSNKKDLVLVVTSVPSKNK